MLTVTSLLFSAPPPAHHPPLLLKCKQPGSVTASPPISHSPIHITCTHSHSFPSLSAFLSLWVFQCALVWSKTALWHCVKHPWSRKHQTTKSNLQKDGHRGIHASVCPCMCVCVRARDKQLNKLERQERGMTLSLPSAHRWKVGRCPSEVRFCTDLKEEGRACIRAAV